MLSSNNSFPPFKSAVEPSSLIMCRMACFYCSEDLFQGATSKRVSFHFGIIHCDKHADLATRDVLAYLHKNKMIRLADALSHPTLHPLFEILQNGVQIKRSNGQFDPGWQLLDDPYDTPNLIRKIGDDWLCILCKSNEMEDMVKYVSLNKIFDAVPNTPDSHIELLRKTIQAMDDGIYKDLASEQANVPILEGPDDSFYIQKMLVKESLCVFSFQLPDTMLV